VTFWTFLHIASMFAAVSIFVGQGVLSGAVARSGDVRALRRVPATEDRFAPVGGGIFALGILFGFITAISGDLDLTQTWLCSRRQRRRARTTSHRPSCAR
jgi:hypothetical protein